MFTRRQSLLTLAVLSASMASFQCTEVGTQTQAKQPVNSPAASAAGPVVMVPPPTQPFPIPPQGFDRIRQGIPHGKLETIDYPSKAINGTRHVDVWTPPDYSADKKYPLLILLHGIGGNETHEWTGRGNNQGQANVVLDNLIADKKITPMVVIFPNGNAETNATVGPGVEPNGGAAPAGGRRGAMGPAMDADGFVFTQAAPAPGGGAPGGRRGGGGGGAPGGAAPGGRGGGGPNAGPGWTNFTSHDLLEDLVPFMESHYSLYKDRDHQALAGLSMGGMQTRTVVTANLDRFAYVGVFSGGNLLPENINDMAKFKNANRLVFMSFGSNESSQGRGGSTQPSGPVGIELAYNALKKEGINATYYVSPNSAHDMTSWKRSLYYFSQLLFTDLPKP